ncbi:hypothetical protein PIB30_055360 [Stylosanthes scabra]|uniref:RNase H type-1 domain-containing protein n=1 Tax=Stylosanthes scabra TaxID=79078 RepID=A0ABU6YHX7_9FABA|nr:hypothetical protein [Stylosanthes scabra]
MKKLCSTPFVIVPTSKLCGDGQSSLLMVPSSNREAERHAMLAKDNVTQNLVVESDSKCALLLFQKTKTDSHGSSSLVRLIKEIVASMNSVVFCHIYREANFCAEAMAKYSHSHNAGVLYCSNPPSSLQQHLLVDLRWIKFPRLLLM